ncbi:nanoRNase/pAp phosphatase, hydrolyzes c-di-AMP and oligoRNAs [Quadrisphaera granulorum]|uniref:NanoRNase/pAp phosphatase (C-di-AMP/oligoRNAs hydrolase) n=1 Tax=Quadrisphaera granulorum TaxID=317664 RepID=A0A315ZJS4_9ACTN|nr:exopolyphosphatase [Quadrisphaera granulorum]PWJ45791.1 nanoRNase/pAp phosphatase (c-di-AMP/oligoRNAs hydrolase) [Quadrisphaera granulorum]SZE99125.1 nanoRNase/pAp phosphatase, hydrolyzes c-di-AMP and oligoRNAs [Quadrisphaera granulorum]
MPTARHRLVTRSDFDGLVCAVLLKHLDLIDEITFVHPKDVQDGSVEITKRDLLTNLPYDPRAHTVFDHHHSEALRNGTPAPGAAAHVIVEDAPSAARVVFEHFGGAEAFPRVPESLMAAVDQADSAQYSLEEVLRPTGWALLNFIMDSRTGLGRFREFTISNYELMMQMIDSCIEHASAEEILALPDVAERVSLYHAQAEQFAAQLLRVSTLHEDVVVIDLRDEEVIHAGNRFLVYALFPQARVSVHVMWGRAKQNTVLAMGRSILDRTSTADIGAVALRHGGGGHEAAGTCQVPHAETERALADLVASLSGSRAAVVVPV